MNDVTTIDHEVVSLQKSNVGRRKKSNNFCDLLGLPITPGGYVGQFSSLQLRIVFCPLDVIFGHDRARTDRINDDVVWSELACHRPSQMDQRSFCQSVQG